MYQGDFPGGTVVKTLPSNAGAVGSIPGQGAYISHASWLKNSNIIINSVKPKKAYHWPSNSTAKILPKGILKKLYLIFNNKILEMVCSNCQQGTC